MDRRAGHHPILGPGFHGWGAWLFVAGLCLVAGIAGLALTYTDPVKVLVAILGLVAGLIFVRISLDHPLATLSIVVLCQIIVPVYIRLPFGLPPPLLMLALLIAVFAARRMLDPLPSAQGRYERLLATVVILYNVAIMITLPSAHFTTGSLMMMIKTVTIPTGLFLIALSVLRTPRDVLTIFRVVMLGAVLCGLLAIHEYATKQNVVADLLAPEVSIEEDFFLWLLKNSTEVGVFTTGTVYRVYSFFTQPLEYSAFMVMTFPFAALMFATETDGRWRLIYGFSALVIFAGFIVSFSRGPTLALALVILFLGVHERRVRPWIAVGAGCLTIGIIAYWGQIYAMLVDRVTSSQNVTLRFRLWENGIHIFQANPVRGIGYGSYPNYHVESIRENQIGPMYEYTWPHIERVTTVENIFVSLAAEAGIVGLSAFLLVIGAVYFVFRRIYTSDAPELTRHLALASIAGVLGYLLSGMTVANIIGYTISILFFGVLISSMAILSRELPDVGPARDRGLARDREVPAPDDL